MPLNLDDTEEMRAPPAHEALQIDEDQLMEEQIARESAICKRFLLAGLVFAFVGFVLIITDFR